MEAASAGDDVFEVCSRPVRGRVQSVCAGSVCCRAGISTETNHGGLAMGALVLTRKWGETVCIGDDVKVRVVRLSEHAVRLAITAPASMGIIREELGPMQRPIQTGIADVADLGRRLLDPLDVAEAYEGEQQ